MNDTLYAILNKSENVPLQYFIFCEKVLDEKYLLKINNVFQPSTNLSLLMFELCSLLCLKLYSLNFAIAHAQKKDCYAYQNSSYFRYIITQETCFITWNKLRNQFRIYQICKKKGKCLHLTKTNREYYINITFPDWVIVENIIPRNVIITFPEMTYSTITQSENVIFILLYRILDPLFSTDLGLPWWGEFQREKDVQPLIYMHEWKNIFHKNGSFK